MNLDGIMPVTKQQMLYDSIYEVCEVDTFIETK